LDTPTPGESWFCFGRAPEVVFTYDGVEHTNDLRSCTYTPLKGRRMSIVDRDTERCAQLVNVSASDRYPLFYQCGRPSNHRGIHLARNEEEAHDRVTVETAVELCPELLKPLPRWSTDWTGP
jgi:hypothetical protein